MADQTEQNPQTEVPKGPFLDPSTRFFGGGDMQDAYQQALRQNMFQGAAQALINAGQPSRIPMTGLQVLNQGLSGAMQGQQAAQQGFWNTMLMQQKLQAGYLDNRLKQANLTPLERFNAVMFGDQRQGGAPVGSAIDQAQENIAPGTPKLSLPVRIIRGEIGPQDPGYWGPNGVVAASTLASQGGDRFKNVAEHLKTDADLYSKQIADGKFPDETGGMGKVVWRLGNGTIADEGKKQAAILGANPANTVAFGSGNDPFQFKSVSPGDPIPVDSFGNKMYPVDKLPPGSDSAINTPIIKDITENGVKNLRNSARALATTQLIHNNLTQKGPDGNFLVDTGGTEPFTEGLRRLFQSQLSPEGRARLTLQQGLGMLSAQGAQEAKKALDTGKLSPQAYADYKGLFDNIKNTPEGMRSAVAAYQDLQEKNYEYDKGRFNAVAIDHVLPTKYDSQYAARNKGLYSELETSRYGNIRAQSPDQITIPKFTDVGTPGSPGYMRRDDVAQAWLRKHEPDLNNEQQLWLHQKFLKEFGNQ